MPFLSPRCNPGAFGVKPRETMSNLGPPRPNFVFYIVNNSKFEGPPFEPPTSAQLAERASVLARESPLTPTRCNSGAFGFKPQ